MKPVPKLSVTLAILAAAVSVSCDRSPTGSPFSASSSKAPTDAPIAIRYEDHIWADGVAPPGDEPRNPHAGDKVGAKDGATLFASMNCDGCHGAGASGWVGPSLADGRWRYGGRDEEIFSSIFYGRPKGMPAYGGLIGCDSVWMLVSYLTSLPKSDVVPTQSWLEPTGAETTKASPPTSEAIISNLAVSTTEFEASLQTNGCAACHAVDRKIVGPAFSDVAAKYRGQPGAEQKLFASAKNGSVGAWGNIRMPPNSAVGDKELQLLVKQIMSLK